MASSVSCGTGMGSTGCYAGLPLGRERRASNSLWWGTGRRAAIWKPLAAELGLANRVCFTGLATREEIPRLVAGFDIALQPASVPYASPLKLFEYMAAGQAIIAPNQPNIREVLEQGRTALLFDPANPEAMWQGIETLRARCSTPHTSRRRGAGGSASAGFYLGRQCPASRCPRRRRAGRAKGGARGNEEHLLTKRILMWWVRGSQAPLMPANSLRAAI